jgi:FixJ family two-component response regulator
MSADRLLVVDDDEAVRKIVVRLARLLGSEARGEARGADFVRAYDEFQPTTIVLDGYLGDVDLEDLIAEIAARRYRGKLIFISGAEDYLELARLKCKRAGLVSRELLKPFGTDELEAVLLDAPKNDPPEG